ncbi:MAG: electron transfer flavoprotein subunit beta/FixA family protein [Fimbriimonadales bacterium]|nr:electron transfer flavoprotein subunit beta/FixA family protein [Fimbriimonadales bacterium]MDW8052134.1 electron transfer flavoprotein subunit beta/FixA family protein [Armatimonadota bacterium]
MKILVSVKRVPDPYAKITPNATGDDINRDGLQMAVNPFDEIALEEAIRLKEAGKATEVVAVSIGGAECQEQLRTALAMGADRAILVQTDASLDAPSVAKILAAVFQREQPQLMLMGKQAIDMDENQVGQMLAARLNLPQATFASKISIENGCAVVERETDNGIEAIRVPLPAIITADLRLNQPRYVALTGIVRARTKPLETLTPAQLGVQPQVRVRLVRVEAPPPRKAGKRVSDVQELVRLLREEARVI